MVALRYRERDFDVQRLTPEELVAARPVKDGIDPDRALGDGTVPPVLAQADSHPQPELRTHRVCEAIPQCGADVVGLHIQLFKRCERRFTAAARRVELAQPAQSRIEVEVGAPRGSLFIRVEEPQRANSRIVSCSR